MADDIDFDSFVERRSPTLARTAYLLTRDHDLAEDDLRDMLAERGAVQATRPSRLDEVHRRIRRRKVARAATGIAAATAAAAVVALAAPTVAGRFPGNDTDGLTAVGSPSATHNQGEATFWMEPPPSLQVRSFPPARYTIKREGDNYRVTISRVGDLEGLRRDLRARGVPAVESPSPGFGDCSTSDNTGRAKLKSPGVWEFVVETRKYDANREVGISNDPSRQVIDLLLYQDWCRTK
ncbi:SigE family RNA polymerase sigma factor [Flindersiella endophytica]